jgi:hypothetical protein
MVSVDKQPELSPHPCMNMFTDVAGWVGAVLLITAFGSTSDRRMTALAICGFVMMAVHLGMLSAWTGTAGYLLSAVGYLVAHYRGMNWRHAVAFSIATVALGVLTWNGWLESGLFIVGNCMAFTVIATLRGLQMRMAMATVTALFLVAFAILGSLPGVVLETCVLASSMRTVFRLWRAPKASEQDAAAAQGRPGSQSGSEQLHAVG